MEFPVRDSDSVRRVKFFVYKNFHGFAKEVAYVLSDTAKQWIRRAYGVEADYAVVKNSIVIKDQEELFVLPDTTYILYKMSNQWNPIRISVPEYPELRTERKCFKTINWAHANGNCFWVYISQYDAFKAKENNHKWVRKK